MSSIPADVAEIEVVFVVYDEVVVVVGGVGLVADS